MKVLILGMGNPILSDDGVGLFIAGRLKDRLKNVDVMTTAMAGLDTLDLISGYDRIFLVDACTTKGSTPGEIVKFCHERNGFLHLFSSHGLNFFELISLGKTLGLEMPEVGGIYGVEIGDEVCFGRELSPELKTKAWSIVEKISADIESSLATEEME
jgi:hydrogenase maturation protease